MEIFNIIIEYFIIINNEVRKPKGNIIEFLKNLNSLLSF